MFLERVLDNRALKKRSGRGPSEGELVLHLWYPATVVEAGKATAKAALSALPHKVNGIRRLSFRHESMLLARVYTVRNVMHYESNILGRHL